MGPFSLYSALFFLLCGGGSYYYFQSEKAALARKKTREASKGYGKPRIGGPFSLIDQNGQPSTSEDLKGKFTLLYFGFSHCPDICPDELDKMGKMIDMVKKKRGNVMNAVVVTCDPARDTPEVLKQYLAEFHSDMIGLTGSWEDVRNMCKNYRVYFSTPPVVKPGQDYLVDHSIYFYLMGESRFFSFVVEFSIHLASLASRVLANQHITDPDNDFIEVIGREHTAEKGAKLVTDHIGDWQGPLDRS